MAADAETTPSGAEETATTTTTTTKDDAVTEEPVTTTTNGVDDKKDKDESENKNGDQGDNKDNNNKDNKQRNNNNRQQRQKDETPIEELYDLTKPIPKVDKPDKVSHDKELEEITAAIEKIKSDRSAVQTKIDNAMSDPDAKETLQAARTKFNQLKVEKNTVYEQRQELHTQLHGIQAQKDKLLKDKKEARNNIRFSSITEIEQEIARLQRQQETTTMSLSQEKRLIKEMDSLQASKKYVADLQEKDIGLQSVKEQRESMNERISAKTKEMDVIGKQMDEIMSQIKAINEKETKKRDAIQELFKERDELKKNMGIKLKEKDTMRDEFRQKNNEFYNFQRAIRAQKKMQYEEEKRKREEERAAYLAALEAEEAKKIPYEEEQALCEYLANYLERTYMGGKTVKTHEDDDPLSALAAKKKDFVPVENDPFAGLKPMKKKDDEEYFGKGKGKKKRERPKKKQDAITAPFTLSVDSFEQFGMIGLNPPTSIEQVENSIKELRERKQWYKEQPRNSVPTAAQIRKEREKEAAKLRHQTDAAAVASASASSTTTTATSGGGGTSDAAEASDTAMAAGGKKKKGSGGGGAFSLSNDDFAPLVSTSGGGAASSSVNTSWGQKPAVVADPSMNETPPEDDDVVADGEATAVKENGETVEGETTAEKPAE